MIEEFEEGDHPYNDRRIGITKKTQEKEEERALQWWRGSICPSCKKGFNSKSTQKQCHSCDRYTHTKRTCISTADDNTVFLCKVCKPSEDSPNPRSTDKADRFNCTKCNFKSAFNTTWQDMCRTCME